MPRLMNRLSARKVKNARPRKGRTAQDFADGGGLHLQCTLGPDGHVRRSWVFKYELNHRRRDLVGLPPKQQSSRMSRDDALSGRVPLDHGAVLPLPKRYQ